MGRRVKIETERAQIRSEKAMPPSFCLLVPPPDLESQHCLRIPENTWSLLSSTQFPIAHCSNNGCYRAWILINPHWLVNGWQTVTNLCMSSPSHTYTHTQTDGINTTLLALRRQSHLPDSSAKPKGFGHHLLSTHIHTINIFSLSFPPFLSLSSFQKTKNESFS